MFHARLSGVTTVVCVSFVAKVLCFKIYIYGHNFSSFVIIAVNKAAIVTCIAVVFKIHGLFAIK